MSGANDSRNRRIRIGLALTAAGAITFGAVADSFAQRGGFGGGGFRSGNFGGGGFSTGGRMPGGDGPRNPGGGYPGGPRFPGGGGGIIVPGGYGGPGTVVIVDDDDDAPVRQGRFSPSRPPSCAPVITLSWPIRITRVILKPHAPSERKSNI